MPVPHFAQVLSAMQCEYQGAMTFPRCVYGSLKWKTTTLREDIILSRVCCVTGKLKL